MHPSVVIQIVVNGWIVEVRVSELETHIFVDYDKMIQFLDSILEPPPPEPPY